MIEISGMERAARFACKMIDLAKEESLTKSEFSLSLVVAKEFLKPSSVAMELLGLCNMKTEQSKYLIWK